MTAPLTPLKMKVLSLKDESSAWRSQGVEGWLLALANARGYRVVVPSIDLPPIADPGMHRLTNEELVCAILSPSLLDRPQMLRLAAQAVSRGDVDVDALLRLTKLERAGRVLRAMAESALRIEPDHPGWKQLHETLRDEPPLRDVLIHWTRLAEPIPSRGLVAKGWKLVA